MNKVLIITFLALSVVGCKKEDPKALEMLESCIHQDQNPFLVELRRQAADSTNITAKMVLQETCKEIVKSM